MDLCVKFLKKTINSQIRSFNEILKFAVKFCQFFPMPTQKMTKSASEKIGKNRLPPPPSNPDRRKSKHNYGSEKDLGYNRLVLDQ